MKQVEKRPDPMPQDRLTLLGRTTGRRVRSWRRNGRYLPWFGVAFLTSCVIGGVAAYIAKYSDDSAAPSWVALSLQDVEDVNAGRNTGDAQTPPQIAPSPPPSPPPPPQLEPVDTYPAADLQVLADWPQAPGSYGYLDVVAIGGDNPGALTSRPLSNDDVLTASGWAGHQKLGMSMTRVMFAMCGKIVGSVAVNRPRPDVAQAVHPNLDKSGWSAQLAVAHLPRCDDSNLTVFGLGGKGPILWPLEQTAVLRLPPKDDAKAALFTSRADVIERNMRPTPNVQSITISASNLRVRACGGSQCAVLGRVGKGVYKGYAVEHRDGWVLMQLPKVSGWLSEKYVRIGS